MVDTVRQIIILNGKIKYDIVGSCDHSDFEVVSRIWVRSDGEVIREWTNDEYVHCDPKRTKIVEAKVADVTINVEAHCVEQRNVFATRDGKRLFQFMELIDYSKE